MKPWLGALVVAFAVSASAMPEDEGRSLYFQPCSSWKYDFESSSYVCSYLDMRARVYETREVDQMVRQLESTIQRLEGRVAALEAERDAQGQ